MNDNLYICDKYFIYLFDNKEDMAGTPAGFNIAIDSDSSLTVAEIKLWIQDEITWWSRRKKIKLRYITPGEPILILHTIGECWKILVGERIGWIIALEWLEIKMLQP